MLKLVLSVILLAATAALAFQGEMSVQGKRIICTIPRGEVVKMVKPIYPPTQAAQGVGGKVILRVSLNTAGEPTNIELTEGSPMLVSAAIDAVKQWRWKPFRLNGKAVPTETTVTVRFVPKRKSSQADRNKNNN